MLNPISLRARWALGLMTIVALMSAVLTPSQLATVFSERGFTFPLIIALSAVVIAFGLSLSGILKRFRGFEVIPFAITVVFTWIAIFVTDGQFEITPGSWRSIWPASWVTMDPLPLTFIGVALAFSLIALAAPDLGNRHELAVRSAIIR